MIRHPPNQRNATVRPVYDRRALTRLGLMFISGLVVAGGFVFAAGQHFKAVHYGYDTETLRREHDRLVEEQHRLILVREQATAPDRLEAAARALGLQPLAAAQIEIKKTSLPQRPDPVNVPKPKTRAAGAKRK